jgi:cytochrome c551/c552
MSENQKPWFWGNGSTKTPVELGESIFLGKGTCVSCHKVDEMGPSVQDIAKMYKEKMEVSLLF